LILAAAPALAQVYRWVDENGVTHYGERAPQGTKATEVQDKLATPAPSGKTPRDDWQEKDRELRQRQLQTQAAEAKKAQDDARRRQICAEQRDALTRLKTARRTYKLDANGERIYDDDDQREARIAKQEQIVAQNCPSEGH
jgi:hypothetical protein